MPTTQLWFWIGFNALVLVLLALDLGVFHRRSHVQSLPEALGWSAFWMSLGLLFSVFIYFSYQNHWGGLGLNPDPTFYPEGLSGGRALRDYLFAYTLEESLSVDNLFVFLMLFTYFRVPGAYHHRVLFWGILGAIAMRAVFILLGMELVQKFHWLIYVFGAFLIYTGLRMFAKQSEEVNPDRNPVLKFCHRFLPMTTQFHQDHFFIRQAGHLVVTPLFVVLLVVQSTDFLFSMDSIPAVLGATRDKFIAYTSNIFAVLGLRAIYFALAGMMQMFHYLNYGLAVILVFIGAKMIAEHWYKLPDAAALGVVGTVLGASVIASLMKPDPVAEVSTEIGEAADLEAETEDLELVGSKRSEL